MDFLSDDMTGKILKEDEGLDLVPRVDKDAQGNAVGMVIGHGHNFIKNPFTPEELSHILVVDEQRADWLLWHDRLRKASELSKVSIDLQDYNPIVAAVIECCAYVMGAKGFRDHMIYRRTYEAFLNCDMQTVANGLRQSLTYQQTGKIRFERYCRMLEQNRYIDRTKIKL